MVFIPPAVVPVNYPTLSVSDFGDMQAFLGWLEAHYPQKNVIGLQVWIRPAGVPTGPVDKYLVTGKTATGTFVLDKLPNTVSTGEQTYSVGLLTSDRIGVVGDSYSANSYALLGKHWQAQVSAQTDYQWETFAVPGYDAAELTSGVRDNLHPYHATLGIQNVPCNYYLVMTNTNDSNWYSMSEDYYRDNMKGLAEVLHSLGGKPLIATEHGTNPNTNGKDNRFLRMLRGLADRYGTPLIDTYTKTTLAMQSGPVAAQWVGGHPGTRTNHLLSDSVLPYIQHLPRPRQSLKLFRKRSSIVVSTVNDLLFDTLQDRGKLFKEIASGHHALSNANYFDRLDLVNAAVAVNSEYLSLIGGGSVALGTYSLLSAVINATARGVSSLSLTLSDSAVSVYVRHLLTPPYELTEQFQGFRTTTDPGVVVGDTYTSNDAGFSGVTFTVYAYAAGYVLCRTTAANPSIRGGTFTLTRQTGTGVATATYDQAYIRYDPTWTAQYGKPEGQWLPLTGDGLGNYPLPADKIKGSMNYDRLEFLLYKSSGVTLTAPPVLNWAGIEGKERNPIPTVPLTLSTNTELLDQTHFGTSGELAGWVVNGTLTPTTPSDGKVYYGTTGYVSITTNNWVSKTLTLTAEPRRSRTLQLTVVARYNPAAFDPTGTLSSNTINLDSYDYATLEVQVGDTLTAGTYLETRPVGLTFVAHVFNVDVPAWTTAQVIKVRSRDKTTELWEVSAKLL